MSSAAGSSPPQEAGTHRSLKDFSAFSGLGIELFITAATGLSYRIGGVVTDRLWLIVLLLIFSPWQPGAQAATLVVDPSGGEGFSTISKAVNAAEDGDEILVRPGYYREGVIPLLRPLALNGSAGETTLEGGFRVEAPGTNISGFEMRGSGTGVGVELRSKEATIRGCIIRNFSTGILSSDSDNAVVGSAIEGCSVGVLLSGGTVRDLQESSVSGVEALGPAISNCTISGGTGVVIANCSGCAVSESLITARTGVLITDSPRTGVRGNEISSPERGIAVERSEESEILENVVTGATNVAILLLASGNSTVAENSALGCNVGIRLKDSTANRILKNRMEESAVAGIWLEGSKGNVVAGNLLSGNVEGLIFRSGSSGNSILENQILKNGRGLTLLGSGANLLRKNRMEYNHRAFRVDREDPSATDDAPFRQDADSSNTIDGKAFCYLVGEHDRSISGDYGLLALVGCTNVTVESLALSNNSAGALIVNSSGCTARNLTLLGNDAGVRMLWTAGCEVEASRADNCTIGFLVQGGKGASIEGSSALRSSEAGFLVQGSEASVLRGVEASEGLVGISVVNSTSATILQARAMGNTEEGIKISRSPRSVLNNNIASGNRWGIRASGSDGTMVVRSHLSENRDAGLALLQLSAATVAGSSAFDNGDGVFLQAVVGAKIEGNNLSNNRRYGLRMSYSREGKVYGNTFVKNGLGGTGLVDCTGCIIRHNNFIDNGNPMSPQNAVDNGDNSWDGGAEVGGNFWSDHQVTGNPGSDPKTVPTRGVDRYPFQDPDGWRKK